jgi:hypothetical protein
MRVFYSRQIIPSFRKGDQKEMEITPLNPIYPTNPLWHTFAFIIVIFEIIIIIAETLFLSWFFEKKGTKVDFSLIFVGVFVANAITFAFGVLVQIYLSGGYF